MILAYDLGWSRLSKCTWPTIKWNTVITLFSGTVFHPLSCGMVCLFMFKNHDTGVSSWIFYILTDEKVVSWTKQNGSHHVNGHEKLCQKTTKKDVFHFVWINCAGKRCVAKQSHIQPWLDLLVGCLFRMYVGNFQARQLMQDCHNYLKKKYYLWIPASKPNATGRHSPPSNWHVVFQFLTKMSCLD